MQWFHLTASRSLAYSRLHNDNHIDYGRPWGDHEVQTGIFIGREKLKPNLHRDPWNIRLQLLFPNEISTVFIPKILSPSHPETEMGVSIPYKSFYKIKTKLEPRSTQYHRPYHFSNLIQQQQKFYYSLLAVVSLFSLFLLSQRPHNNGCFVLVWSEWKMKKQDFKKIEEGS